MSRLIDLTGQRFGRLTVVSRAENTKNGHPRWLCRCDCGSSSIVVGKDLRSGHTESCGCLQKERTSKSNQKLKNYGEAETRLYKIWLSMKQRTTNKNAKAYKNYGARGIVVCKEWKDDYQVFKEWALLNGYHNYLTIERRDNEKGYFPQNCTWIVKSEQPKNRRSNNYITYNGETKTLSEWARLSGIQREVLRDRINNYGWSIEKALTTPTRKK